MKTKSTTPYEAPQLGKRCQFTILPFPKPGRQRDSCISKYMRLIKVNKQYT